jgi:hypothetical protein
MTLHNKNLLDRFPPGSSAHRYRLTPEEIERKKRWNQIQRERDERYLRKLIEEGEIGPDTESDKKTA